MTDAAGHGEPDLVVEQVGGAMVLRINRPAARNALTLALLADLTGAIARAEADPDIRAVVITGTGDRAFCAGMDLREFAGGAERPSGANAVLADYQRLMRGEVAVPLIGAANASALAGGFELLLSCDLIVASSEARFGLPEVKRGLFAGGNGTTLGARIPLAIALEMALLGDSISAGRAQEIGLVNAVVEPTEVLATALSYAERIAANAPLSVAATKELVRLAVVDGPRAAARLAELQPVVFASADAREGATAFVEKRPPVWQGR